MAEPGLSALIELERLIRIGGEALDVRVVHEIQTGGKRLPIHAVMLGSADPGRPALGIFGGIHGLELIGAEVALEFLRHLVMRLAWDEDLHHLLGRLRLVFMPLVNPGGIWRGTRANPNGVDLMRNSPVEAREPAFLLGGQRISRFLPWYRGRLGAAMEAENRALCAIVESELLGRPFSLALDCHSGFGLADRIWFPYAHTEVPIAHLAEIHALKSLFEQAHAHHDYLFEPQSRQYLTHGDIWDHLYRASLAAPERIFLPLTLEMGSWLWVKKNPRQIFSRFGIFNPGIARRQQRVLRRHIAWFDFLAHAAASYQRWLPDEARRRHHHELALREWYPDPLR